jgi:cytochrome c551/c552
MRWTKRILIIVVIGLAVMQFIPLERSNPSERGQFAAPAEIETILRRACYDCHSNETRWRWYAWIAPISFLLVRDVKDGRQELNFSIWDRYEQRRKTRKLKEIIKEVEEGDMPPWYYVPVHADAKLSQVDREAIVTWAKRQL